jgi:hypothetical protein
MFVPCVMLCCPVKVEASATGLSLVQRSPTVCLVVCDFETSIRKRTRLIVGCSVIGEISSEVGNVWLWLNLRYCPGICLVVLRKATKNVRVVLVEI